MVIVAVDVCELEIIRRICILKINPLVILVASESEELGGERSFTAAMQWILALFLSPRLGHISPDSRSPLLANYDADDEAKDEYHQEEGRDVSRMLDEETMPVAVGFVGMENASGILKVLWDASLVGPKANSQCLIRGHRNLTGCIQHYFAKCPTQLDVVDLVDGLEWVEEALRLGFVKDVFGGVLPIWQSFNTNSWNSDPIM